jgi:hypothetical protein
MKPVVRRLVALLSIFTMLAFAAPVTAAKRKKPSSSKAWPSSKKSGHKPGHRPTGVEKRKPAKAPGETPADEADEADAEEAETEAPRESRPTKARATKERQDEGEDQADADGDGDEVVVKKSARRAAAAGAEAAPVAVELSAGPRVVHRNFDYNDPLADFQPGAARPYAYKLPLAPAPFIDVAIYPLAFAGRGFMANLGLVGGYEKLVGTTTVVESGTPTQSTATTSGQQFFVGARGRLPLGEHELGVGVAYGKHSFHVSDHPAGPQDPGVPNVDYTFVRAGLDGRLNLGAVSLGARLGTRLVTNTGSLGQDWFPSTKTQSIEAGVQLAYHLTPMFELVAGADFLRYAFNFNPVAPTNPVIAGGAVDQYISGWLALRVSILGS